MIYAISLDARIDRSRIQKVFRCTIPEGVEVKISVDLIKPLVVGKYIRNIAIGDNSRYKTNNPKGMKEFFGFFS